MDTAEILFELDSRPNVGRQVVLEVGHYVLNALNAQDEVIRPSAIDRARGTMNGGYSVAALRESGLLVGVGGGYTAGPELPAVLDGYNGLLAFWMTHPYDAAVTEEELRDALARPRNTREYPTPAFLAGLEPLHRVTERYVIMRGLARRRDMSLPQLHLRRPSPRQTPPALYRSHLQQLDLDEHRPPQT